jgi:hypothetical protein
MAYPGAALVTMIADALPSGVNTYDTPTPNLTAPAVVVRPDEPWIVPDKFCHDRQRYVAIGVVQAATPQDGIKRLYDIATAIIDAVSVEDSAWSFDSVGAPVIDETTGLAYLAAPIRLSYRNSGEDES